MCAFSLHHFVEKRDIKRHHRNGGAGLGDERFVHRDPSLALDGSEFLIKRLLHTLKVFFGNADRAILIDRPSDFRSDIRIGNGLGTLC